MGCVFLLCDRVILKEFSNGLRLTLHPQKYHFFSTHRLNLLTSEDTSDPTLDEFCSDLFFLLVSGFRHFAFANLALCLVRYDFGQVLLKNLLHTDAALTTTLILLNHTDSRHNFHIQGEGVHPDLLNRLRAFISWGRVVFIHNFVDLEFLLLHGLWLG